MKVSACEGVYFRCRCHGFVCVRHGCEVFEGSLLFLFCVVPTKEIPLSP